MNTQKATITAEFKSKDVGAWRDSAEHYKTLVVALDDGMKEAIKVLIKYPRDGAGRVRMVAWFFGKNPENMGGAKTYRHGCGSASGCGYHKASAAFQEAANDAGISLDNDINGRGEGAVDDAMIAIAEAMYGQKFELRKNALII